MTTKRLVLPDGKSFSLGRNRPVPGPRLHLRNYLFKSLPPAPPSIDYSAKALDFLSLILANDTLGDCTGAGAFHIGGLLLANADKEIPYTVEDVIKFYSATTGYVSGQPSTDQGGDEQTVLNYWRQHGLLSGTDDPHKIAGWVAVDGTNPEEVKTALYLFENLYFGVELPNKWLHPFPSGSGFIWDIAGNPNPEQGHCFTGVGYNEKGVIIDTWGFLGTLTWEAIDAYATGAGSGELYAVFGPDSINRATKKAPNGFDAAQLLVDLNVFRPIKYKNTARKAHAFIMYGLGGSAFDPQGGEAYLVQRLKAAGINTHQSPYQYYDTQTIAAAIMKCPKEDAIIIGGDSLGANDGPVVAQGVPHRLIDYLFGFQPSQYGVHVKVPSNVLKALCIYNPNWWATMGLGNYPWERAEGNTKTDLRFVKTTDGHPGDNDIAVQNIILNDIRHITELKT